MTLDRHSLRRIAVAGQCLLIVLCTAWALFESPAPIINIRWREGLSAEARRQTERELYVEEYLENGNEGHYEVHSPRRSNLRAIIAHPDVADTFRLNREQATLNEDSYLGSLRVWWAGPFWGASSRVQFRVVAVLIALVTLVCTALLDPHPRTFLRRVFSLGR